MILVKDCTWDLSSLESHLKILKIKIPLFNTHPSKVSVRATPVYLSANYPPYFWELDLAERIDPESTAVSINSVEGFICFDVALVDASTMSSMSSSTVAYTLPDRLERRKKGEVEYLAMQEDLKKSKIVEKRERERDLVRAQMSVEREARLAIQERKEREVQNAKDHIAAWSKDILSAAASSAKPKERDILEEAKANEILKDAAFSKSKTDSAIFDTDSDATSQQVKDYKNDNQVFEEEESDEDIDLDAIRNLVKKQLQGPQHAPPRASATTRIAVTFTGRGAIPTQTARETEDAKWMTRIKLAKAMNALKGGKESPEGMEAIQKARDAREKGTTFFRLGNFEGAINAFTQALHHDSQDISALANRAACFLKLEDLEACVDDCTRALDTLAREQDIMEREIKADDGLGEQRNKQRIKLLVRRGSAYCMGVGGLDDAVADYKEALRLDPENEGIKRDLEALVMQSQVVVSTTS